MNRNILINVSIFKNVKKCERRKIFLNNILFLRKSILNICRYTYTYVCLGLMYLVLIYSF